MVAGGNDRRIGAQSQSRVHAKTKTDGLGVGPRNFLSRETGTVGSNFHEFAFKKIELLIDGREEDQDGYSLFKVSCIKGHGLVCGSCQFSKVHGLEWHRTSYGGRRGSPRRKGCQAWRQRWWYAWKQAWLGRWYGRGQRARLYRWHVRRYSTRSQRRNGRGQAAGSK
jgi:hypothetical protein